MIIYVIGVTVILLIVQVSQLQMAGITQMGNIQGQLLTHQGSTYLVQGGTMDGEGHPLAHTTRASPVTVSIPLTIKCVLTVLSFILLILLK